MTTTHRSNNILLNILGVFLGIMAVGLFTALIQRLGHTIFPVDEAVSKGDAEAIKNYMKDAPLGALLFVPLSYLIAAFAGGLVTSTLIRSSKWKLLVCIPGLFTILGAVMALVTIPHPTWLALLMLIPPIPAALFGGSYFGNKHNA